MSETSSPSTEKDLHPHHQDASQMTQQDPAEFRDASIPPWRFAMLALGLCLGLFIAMLDSSIVATSLFTIGIEFGDLERINWVALAYTLSFLGCAVFFARMADIVGRRDAFIAAYLIFFSFSLGCGFAQDLNMLIACRVLQGVGGSGLFSVTMIIFPELSSQKMRNWIAAVIGIVVSTAGVLGPVLGGIFTHYATWRWVFWINAPIGFVSMVLFYFSWPEAEYLPTFDKRSWRDLDFAGSFLVIAAAVLVVFSFQNAGESTRDPWGRAIFVAPLAVGIVCWAVLFAWEGWFERAWKAKMAALPLVLLRNHVYAAAVVNTTFLGFAYIATLYAVPLRLQVVNGESPLLAGVMLLPMLGGSGAGASIAGALSSRKNRLSETIITASLFVMLGCALETTVSDSGHLEAKALGFLVLIGIGFGMSTSAATMFTAIEAPISEHAPAQGIIAQFRMLGGSIGIAMSSAVLATKQRGELDRVVGQSALLDLRDSGAGLTPEQHAAVRRAYNDAFTETMAICAAIAGAAALLAAGTYSRKRLSLAETREEQIKKEIERRRAQKGDHIQSMSSGQSA